MSNNDNTPKVPKVHESELEDTEESDGPIVDPKVKEEVQNAKGGDEFFAEYATNNGGDSEQVDVTKNWIGDDDGDNWKPKTFISAEQIIAFSQVRMLGDAFEELEEIEHMLDNTVKNLEQYAVSREGMARTQHVDVLQAMHSGEMHNNDASEALANIFSAPKEDE